MRNRSVAFFIVVAVALLASTGCVSKGMFRKNVAASEARVDSVESAVEANERRIGEMRSETDRKLSAVEGATQKAEEVGNSAMAMASKASQAAEEARRGRLIWNVTLTDDAVKFSFGQNALPSSASAALDDLVQKIKGYNKAVFVEIEGHTDSAGSEDYNFMLGEKRANAVRQYLGAAGLPLHAINTISYGETRPVADNSTKAGRSQNRRVVIRVLE